MILNNFLDKANYLPDIVFYIAVNSNNIPAKCNWTRVIELTGTSQGPQGK